MVASTDKSAPPKPTQHFVDAAPEGSVMLVQAPPKTESAIWGGLMTARAQSRGVKGVVLDGKCRDLAEQWESGFAVSLRTRSRSERKEHAR
jgi:regulator of RNase E activity RraA